MTTIINNIQIPNTLIDLGATINVMTLETMRTLQLTNLQHTTIVLELADRSKVIPEGILEDMFLQNIFHTVTNAKVGSIHMTSN